MASSSQSRDSKHSTQIRDNNRDNNRDRSSSERKATPLFPSNESDNLILPLLRLHLTPHMKRRSQEHDECSFLCRSLDGRNSSTHIVNNLINLWNPLKIVDWQNQGEGITQVWMMDFQSLCFVLNNQPWEIEGHLLLMKAWKETSSIASVRFDFTPFWVHLQNLPHYLCDEQSVLHIVAKAGNVLSMDLNPMNVSRSSSARVKLEINLTRPIPIGAVFNMNNNDDLSVIFGYEFLPSLCFNCGCVAHGGKPCKKFILANDASGMMFNRPGEPSLYRIYHKRMRVLPKKNNIADLSPPPLKEPVFKADLPATVMEGMAASGSNHPPVQSFEQAPGSSFPTQAGSKSAGLKDSLFDTSPGFSNWSSIWQNNQPEFDSPVLDPRLFSPSLNINPSLNIPAQPPIYTNSPTLPTMNQIPSPPSNKAIPTQAVTQAVTLNLSESSFSVNLPFLNLNQDRVFVNGANGSFVDKATPPSGSKDVLVSKEPIEVTHPFPRSERRGEVVVPSTGGTNVQVTEPIDYSNTAWAKKLKSGSIASSASEKEKDFVKNCVEFDNLNQSASQRKRGGVKIVDSDTLDNRTTQKGKDKDSDSLGGRRTAPRKYKRHDDVGGNKLKNKGKEVAVDGGKSSGKEADTAHGFRMVGPNLADLENQLNGDDDLDLLKHHQIWVGNKNIQPISTKRDTGSIHVPQKK